MRSKDRNTPQATPAAAAHSQQNSKPGAPTPSCARPQKPAAGMPDDIRQSQSAAEAYLDRIRGSLFGGAAGDALGYPVEFLQEGQIFAVYGKGGITEYALANGIAQISDDTQMTLFTASGILAGDTPKQLPGTGAAPAAYVLRAYLDWLQTQRLDSATASRHARCTKEDGYCCLMGLPELYARRAPGITCLSALEKRAQCGASVTDFIHSPINNSKGCGGIMRVAPIALRYRPDKNAPGGLDALDMQAAQLAAITHSHPLGYMPAAVAAHIISRCVTSCGEMRLKEMVIEARDTAARLFAGDPYLGELTGMIDRAIHLSENDAPDLDNIHALGEGWVAEETLGIAIYCALKYQHDFSKAIIAAVNHNGDSDSTGAVTGNIVGALLGYSAIEDKWKTHLELAEVILEMAGALCHGCPTRE